MPPSSQQYSLQGLLSLKQKCLELTAIFQEAFYLFYSSLSKLLTVVYYSSCPSGRLTSCRRSPNTLRFIARAASKSVPRLAIGPPSHPHRTRSALSDRACLHVACLLHSQQAPSCFRSVISAVYVALPAVNRHRSSLILPCPVVQVCFPLC